MDLVVKIGHYIGPAAVIGLLLMIPLYLSQSRDVKRLTLWADRDPNAPNEVDEFAAAEARAAQQAAVARVTGRAETTRAEVRQAARESAAAERASARRALRQRPAGMGTAEHRALADEPAWRRFFRRGPTARELVVATAAVFAIGIGGIAGTLLILHRGEDTSATSTRGGVVPSEIKVASLNGTAVPGLAGKVGDDIKSNGYQLGAVTNSPSPANTSYVMFERGHEQEAQAVAHDLGIKDVKLIDKETSALSQGAPVVVVAGEDRAS